MTSRSWSATTRQSRGNHEIKIKAEGYLDAVVTQFITFGSIYGEECVTLSGTLSAVADANGQITLDNIVVDLPDGSTEVSNVALEFTGNNSFGL